MDQTSDDGDEPDVRFRPLPDMVILIESIYILVSFCTFFAVI